MDNKPLLETDLTFISSEYHYSHFRIHSTENNYNVDISPDDLGKGGFSLTTLSNYMAMGSIKIQRAGKPFSLRSYSPDGQLAFSFFLEEGGSIVSLYDGNKRLRISPGLASLSYFPSPIEITFPRDSYFKSFTFFLSKDFLHAFLSQMNPGHSCDLERIILFPHRHYIHSSNITSSMTFALEQIENCPFHGVLQKLYLQGKALELLAMKLEQLNCSKSGSDYVINLTEKDLERIRKAKEILISDLQSPPSLNELARASAINTKKLKYGFKDVYGMTAFAYLRQERLNSARKLLEKGDKNVTEIAFEVGYNSLSHFSAAFKKEFGVLPHNFHR